MPFLFHDQFSWAVCDSGASEISRFEMSEEEDKEERGVWGDEMRQDTAIFTTDAHHRTTWSFYFLALFNHGQCAQNVCMSVTRAGVWGDAGPADRKNSTARSLECFESLHSTRPPAELRPECGTDIIVRSHQSGHTLTSGGVQLQSEGQLLLHISVWQSLSKQTTAIRIWWPASCTASWAHHKHCLFIIKLRSISKIMTQGKFLVFRLWLCSCIQNHMHVVHASCVARMSRNRQIRHSCVSVCRSCAVICCTVGLSEMLF